MQDDRSEESNLLLLEQHLNQCAVERKNGDWKRVIRKVDDAVAAGADFCPQVVLCSLFDDEVRLNSDFVIECVVLLVGL